MSACLDVACAVWHTCQSGSLSRGFEERSTSYVISDVNCRSAMNNMYLDEY